jgi:hypothetical protein
MNKEFINYTEALALKELGFDESCFGYYVGLGDSKDDPFKLVQIQSEKEQFQWTDNVYHAPLYQQCFRWFREKYQIDSWIYPNLNGLYSVSNIRRGVGLGKVSEYQTYEEAELECLKKLIEIVKQNE